MRQPLYFVIFLLLVSCDWFESTDTKTQKLVDREIQQINWNDVDQYPLFDNCDETTSKAEQKACFETTLLTHFSMTIQDFEFELNEEVNDTLYVYFLMDNAGAISVLDIDKNDGIEAQIPEFSGIIAQSLKSLPKVAPALKRGIPVAAKFRIPLIVRTH